MYYKASHVGRAAGGVVATGCAWHGRGRWVVIGPRFGRGEKCVAQHRRGLCTALASRRHGSGQDGTYAAGRGGPSA